MVKTFKKEFEKKIIELGFSFSSYYEGIYILRDENNINHLVNIQWIESISPIKQMHGSKNGNKIQVIGLFKFKRMRTAPKPDFFIFTFKNPHKNLPEYLIIPEEEVERRLTKCNSDLNHDRKIRIVFWLMQDGSIYETTHISPEGEWFYLSKGIDGRMADRTEKDYTIFLNSWYMLRSI